MAADRKSPPYRREVFKHGLNVALLVAGGLAGLLNPLWWIMTAALEGGILWIVPDIPFVRKRLDEKFKERARLTERAYYLEQLFGLREKPERGFLARLLFETEETADELDERLSERAHPDVRPYFEMREIVGKLREHMQVRGARITEADLLRLEDVINGYLRLLFACDPLHNAASNLDERKLNAEMRQVEEELDGASPAVRPVLMERLRIARAHLERLPKLQATLQLFRTRAESLVHQVRQIHSQVLADPGTDVANVLDTMIERQELFNDPLGDLSAEQLVREFENEPSSRVQSLRAAERKKTAEPPKRRAGQKN